MEVDTAIETETSTVRPGDLIAALEQATLMAKQLPTTTTADPSQLLQIHTALHSAHRHLSLFLSHHHHPPPPHHPQQTENSVSSAVGGDEPMQMGDDDEDEQNSMMADTVEKVEWRMRECFFIQNKRPKRQLSPNSVAVVEAEQRRSYENKGARGGGAAAAEFHEPLIGDTRLRSLDLIYQFHA